MSGSVAGAEMITFLAPASRCFCASSRLVNRPVDSITTSTPRSLHGSAAGSFSYRTLSSVPSTLMPSPMTSISPGKRPRTESYLSRWAIISASIRSLTATNSRSAPAAWAARNTFRPMRPKPLMPTLTAIPGPPIGIPILVVGDADLDQVAVGVVEAAAVVPRAERRGAPGLGDDLAAVGAAGLERGLHRRDALRREGDQTVARAL